METHYSLRQQDGPVWAFAIHDGHALDPALVPYCRLAPSERLREEDPFTGIFGEIGTNQLLVHTSRFQLDLNRPVQDAVYLRPEQAWGLLVWKRPLPEATLQSLYSSYYHVHDVLALCLGETIARQGTFVALDIHSYNAKRGGPDVQVDREANPQLNLGTIHNPSRTRPLLDAFIAEIQKQTLFGAPIDVRENVKFSGGHLAEWIHTRFPDTGCVISLEFRKDFMDEWTGQGQPEKIEEIRQLMVHLRQFLEAKLIEWGWTK